MKYSNMAISNVSGITEFSGFLKVSKLLHPRNSSVNSSFHRRGPATANAFSEYLFTHDVARAGSLYDMIGLIWKCSV